MQNETNYHEQKHVHKDVENGEDRAGQGSMSESDSGDVRNCVSFNQCHLSDGAGDDSDGKFRSSGAGQSPTLPGEEHHRTLSFHSFLTRAGSPNSKNSSGTFCRICHDGEGFERFISPCQCAGTVGLVHRSCIEKWLSTANHDMCEICGQHFKIERKPRPFLQWLCGPSDQDDQRNLVGDVACFVLLTPLAVISCYLCTTGATFYLKEKRTEAIGLVCLAVFLVLIYLLWILLTIKYHCQVWSSWQQDHQDIRLTSTSPPNRLNPEAPPSPNTSHNDDSSVFLNTYMTTEEETGTGRRDSTRSQISGPSNPEHFYSHPLNPPLAPPSTHLTPTVLTFDTPDLPTPTVFHTPVMSFSPSESVPRSYCTPTVTTTSQQAKIGRPVAFPVTAPGSSLIKTGPRPNLNLIHGAIPLPGLTPDTRRETREKLQSITDSGNRRKLGQSGDKSDKVQSISADVLGDGTLAST